jgi:hypothetical protein
MEASVAGAVSVAALVVTRKHAGTSTDDHISHGASRTLLNG